MLKQTYLFITNEGVMCGHKQTCSDYKSYLKQSTAPACIKRRLNLSEEMAQQQCADIEVNENIDNIIDLACDEQLDDSDQCSDPEVQRETPNTQEREDMMKKILQEQSLKRSVHSVDNTVQVPAKRVMMKKTTGNLTAWDVVKENCSIRLDNYGSLFSKYSVSEKSGKLEVPVMKTLHIILTLMGTLVNQTTTNAATYVKKYLDQNIEEHLSTIHLNVRQKNMLLKWLKEFITVEEDHKFKPNSDKGVSQLSAFTLPTPPEVYPTSMSCTIASGTNTLVDVERSEIIQEHQASVADQDLFKLLKPRTSSALRCMSFVTSDRVCSLKSKAIAGDFYMKLELYQASKVDGIPPQDWWRNAAFRSFTPIKNKTTVMQQVLQLQRGIHSASVEWSRTFQTIFHVTT